LLPCRIADSSGPGGRLGRSSASEAFVTGAKVAAGVVMAAASSAGMLLPRVSVGSEEIVEVAEAIRIGGEVVERGETRMETARHVRNIAHSPPRIPVPRVAAGRPIGGVDFSGTSLVRADPRHRH
jgi:hypothetical protein